MALSMSFRSSFLARLISHADGGGAFLKRFLMLIFRTTIALILSHM